MAWSSQGKNTSVFFHILLLLIAGILFRLNHVEPTQKALGAAILPTILTAAGCGAVLGGQPPCQLTCPLGQDLKCTWTAKCGSQLSCLSNHVQMADRKCSDNIGDQQQCCSCSLKLRGGYQNSRVFSPTFGYKKNEPSISRKAVNANMKKSDYGQRGFLYPDNMPDTFFLGNDEDWSLETYEAKELDRI